MAFEKLEREEVSEDSKLYVLSAKEEREKERLCSGGKAFLARPLEREHRRNRSKTQAMKVA